MEILTKQFGLLIAYLLPGFVALAGIAPLVPTVAGWLKADQTASFGAPLYALLAATAAGMIASCFRWLLIDHVHQWTGITHPTWDDRRLGDHLPAFSYLVEVHYRYYQFYANTIVALIPVYALNRFLKTLPFLGLGTDLGVVILCAVLFMGSRDALSNYYLATGRLLGQVAEKGHTGDPMTNGRGHDTGGYATSAKTVSDAPVEHIKARDENQGGLPLAECKTAQASVSGVDKHRPAGTSPGGTDIA